MFFLSLTILTSGTLLRLLAFQSAFTFKNLNSMPFEKGVEVPTLVSCLRWDFRSLLKSFFFSLSLPVDSLHLSGLDYFYYFSLSSVSLNSRFFYYPLSFILFLPFLRWFMINTFLHVSSFITLLGVKWFLNIIVQEYC